MIFKVKLVKRLTLTLRFAVPELVEGQGPLGDFYVNERNAGNDCAC